jgi:ABC-type nitrate/sulfonate/bicarbonate transport system permease component
MKLPRPVIPTLLAVIFFGGWEWIVRVGHVNEVLVPAPSHIFKWFYESLTSGELLSATCGYHA